MSQKLSPLAARNGVAASFLQLGNEAWPDLLSFLDARFPHVGRHIWQQRLQRGEVYDHLGQPLALDSPFPANRRIWYYREVEQEVPVPFAAKVLYRDERLLVVDKPHFLACVPGGRHVRETLLTRLREELALPDLTPAHRLDRETAGVMLYCLDPSCRAAYQGLFQQRDVLKVYEAVAPWREDLALPLCYRSRLEERPDSFQMHEVAGEPNSETQIELIRRFGELAHYRLQPSSGRKHQLRAHLAALGIPIVNDPWYPQLLPDKPADDFSQPLQLLARHISFTDPVTGEARAFSSERVLQCLPESVPD